MRRNRLPSASVASSRRDDAVAWAARALPSILASSPKLEPVLAAEFVDGELAPWSTARVVVVLSVYPLELHSDVSWVPATDVSSDDFLAVSVSLAKSKTLAAPFGPATPLSKFENGGARGPVLLPAPDTQPKSTTTSRFSCSAASVKKKNFAKPSAPRKTSPATTATLRFSPTASAADPEPTKSPGIYETTVLEDSPKRPPFRSSRLSTRPRRPTTDKRTGGPGPGGVYMSAARPLNTPGLMIRARAPVYFLFG